MYGKIFTSMFDGSLYGNWKAIVTFQQMIVLCGPDGVLDMTPQALAARTSIPLEVIQEGLAVLEAPDQYSRSPEQDGRRIERIDSHRPWGWRIVNYAKYRKMVCAEEKREADRVRIAEKRRLARQVATGCDGRDMSQASQGIADVAQAEVEVEVEVKKPARKRAIADPLFARFWTAYPRKVDRSKAEKAFAKLRADDELVGAMLEALERAKASEQWSAPGGKFIPYPAKWLSGRRWEDEAPHAPGPDLAWEGRVI